MSLKKGHSHCSRDFSTALLLDAGIIRETSFYLAAFDTKPEVYSFFKVLCLMALFLLELKNYSFSQPYTPSLSKIQFPSLTPAGATHASVAC